MKQHASNKLLPLLLLLLLSSFSTARNTITPSHPLADDEILITDNQQYALGFFTPPDSTNRYLGLWYHNLTQRTVVWVANRENPVPNNSPATLSLNSAGTLTITSNLNNSSPVWSTPPASTPLTNPVALLLDNGNLVIKQSNGTNYAWQGFHHLTDTWLPDVEVGIDPATGLNSTLVPWRSYNDPSPGPYLVHMDVGGDPEFYFYLGSSIIWRTGPWDGTHFSGIPAVSTYKGFSFNFTSNGRGTATYSYSISDRSIVTRLFVNYTGYLQRAIWVWDDDSWNYFWSVPKGDCDSYAYCGAFGRCDPNGLAVCDCLQGFQPRNPANWNLRDASDGCVRRTELDCRNGTDGFVTVSNVKPPDTANSTVDMMLNLEECRDLCSRNCSCTAFASANVSGGGSGCVIWVGELLDIEVFLNSGQDLYVRLAAKDLGTPSSQSHTSRNATIPIVASLIGGLTLVACVGCLLWRRKRSRSGASISLKNHSTRENNTEDDLDLPLFDFDAIVAATDYFSLSNKLGEGGFGPVYKGKLGEVQEIAVKRLARTSTQGTQEFKNEVLLIAKLQHRNLVRLLGCCISGEERMLIYEYMPNRSLDTFLFEKGKGALLDWKTRHQIIEGIARGLLYLHQDSRLRIIHRDLKASNILLDKEMNPKISDFGMARIFGGDETDFNTRKVVGTYGYMSPEYAMDGVFSMKSDVFSFGVLVLETISGKKNRGVYGVPPHVNLIAHAWSLWKQGRSMQLVDDSMSYSFPMDELTKCIKIGLLCVQENPEDRPLMSSVVLMLGSDIAALPQPKQPGFAARRGTIETESSSSNNELWTSNDVSITMLEGR